MGEKKTEETRAKALRTGRSEKKKTVVEKRGKEKEADPDSVSGKRRVGPASGLERAKVVRGENAGKSDLSRKAGGRKSVKKAETEVDHDEALVGFVAHCMLEKKGIHVLSLDMRQVAGASFGFFVICEASSGPQVRAIADEISDKVYERFNEDPLHVEGYANGEWILLDYGNVLAHVFLDSARQHYRLEELWGDAVLKMYKDEE